MGTIPRTRSSRSNRPIWSCRVTVTDGFFEADSLPGQSNSNVDPLIANVQHQPALRRAQAER